MNGAPAGRNESFVRAAKRLLAFQLAAAAGAVALTAWAVVEVRELVHERDRLAAQLAQVERRAPATTAPPPLDPEAAPEPPVAVEAEPVTEPTEEPEPDPDGNVSNRLPPPQFPPPPPPHQTRIECELLDGTASVCTLPWQRVADGICLDVEGRRARCPTGAPPPGGGGQGGEPDPPPPARDCRSVRGQPIVCAPPYRGTPVPGICIDRNNRPMRCPPGQPPREQPREPRPGAAGATPTRPSATRPTRPPATRPSATAQPSGGTRPAGTTRPRPTTSTADPAPTRPRQPTATVPATRQPVTTTVAPPRTARPVTTAPTAVRPAPVRRRPPPPPPESNQAQPQ